jgi:hypothetical protein
MSKIEEMIWKYYDEMFLLKPTPEEMDAFIEHYQSPYGVVTLSTYDKKRGGNSYFMSVHDNHGGHKHYHIDLGYVNFDYKYNNVIHLMLDKIWAESFIDFIKEHRVKDK